MPLYLDEIWLNPASEETLRRGFEMLRGMTANATFPEGVTLKAGPWFSNEEAKLIIVLDIADHAKTFVPFSTAVAKGLILRRRLTPVVEAGRVDELLAVLKG